jgi:hypothetical protein
VLAARGYGWDNKENTSQGITLQHDPLHAYQSNNPIPFQNQTEQQFPQQQLYQPGAPYQGRNTQFYAPVKNLANPPPLYQYGGYYPQNTPTFQNQNYYQRHF